MKIWKRAASAALALAVTAAAVPCSEAAGAASAIVSEDIVYFDGTPSPISAYQIDGSNYFMLRDLAALFCDSKAQFSIDTDAATHTIQITTGQAYVAQGDELAAPIGGDAQAAPAEWQLTVNGSKVPVSAYMIHGFHYYKLRDLGDAVGFSVSYDPATHHINISAEPPAFHAELPACSAVSPSWFDDAAFVGDSVSGWLSFYNGDKGLGQATFLTATSLGIENALKDVSSASVHPSYQGTKMKIEDAIVKCGAKKVYLMLGMNDISYGVERVTADYIQLLDRIQAAAPGVQIYVQSVMPMLSTSKRADSKLNNASIADFNTAMKAACQQKKWYYLDIAGIYSDSNGGLRADACSDASGMGLHITHDATAAWVDYLRTHVPMA